ncbi:NFX1-type zinc finger-containing protein 1-like [Haliotis asinina]|uniref:NFX1-type zinc finger-containing protein 1-like n=1 Tax=Haliotis asinina TaxID=109174 RepID=UPI0035324D52
MFGHVKKCVVATKKTFPCGHVTESECYSSAVQKTCPLPCTKPLQCGHSCKGTCGDCSRNGCTEKCQEIVNVTLKCGHTCRMHCQASKKRYQCSGKCEQTLACGHKCTQNCNQCGMFGHVKKCVVATKKTFPCGHVIESECYSSAVQKTCPLPCTKPLQCGHSCKGTCGDCSRNGCTEKCQEIVNVTLKCGHTCRMHCQASKKRYQCSGKCEQTLACGHKCTQNCNQCGMFGHVKKCVVATKKTFPCGHVTESECYSSAVQKTCPLPFQLYRRHAHYLVQSLFNVAIHAKEFVETAHEMVARKSVKR